MIFPSKLVVFQESWVKGSNVMLTGRYRKPGEGRITLSGSVDGQPVKMDFEGSFPERETENGFVARIWATRKIGYILDQIRKNGTNEELKNEIVTLAKRYGILTPFTSYLVMEDKRVQNGPDLRPIMMPQASDDERSSFEEGKARYSMDRFKKESSGADAVDAAQEMNAMKSVSAPAPSMSLESGFSGRVGRSGGGSSSPSPVRSGLKSPVTREVAERTFYQIEGRWVDSQVKGEKADITVKAYSEAYFALVAKYPEMGKFLALGDKIVVFIAGKSVEISLDAGISEKGALNL